MKKLTGYSNTNFEMISRLQLFYYFHLGLKKEKKKLESILLITSDYYVLNVDSDLKLVVIPKGLTCS